MSDSSFDVDEILKEVRKRREENEERIKAQGTRKSVEINNNTAPAAEKKAEKAGAVDKAQNTVNAVKESVKVQPAQKNEQKPVQQREQKKLFKTQRKRLLSRRLPRRKKQFAVLKCRRKICAARQHILKCRRQLCLKEMSSLLFKDRNRQKMREKCIMILMKTET